MTIEIRVPTLGESVSEATIGRWFKKAGDAVKADEPLVELETDKVTLEVNAPSSGVLAEIAAKDGETVDVGALLGQIADSGAAAGEGRSARPPPRPAPRPQPRPHRRKPPLRPRALPWRPRPPPPRSPPTTASTRPPSPGSGVRGQVLKGDVLAMIAEPGAGARSAPVRSCARSCSPAAPAQARAPSPAPTPSARSACA